MALANGGWFTGCKSSNNILWIVSLEIKKKSMLGYYNDPDDAFIWNTMKENKAIKTNGNKKLIKS